MHSPLTPMDAAFSDRLSPFSKQVSEVLLGRVEGQVACGPSARENIHFGFGLTDLSLTDTDHTPTYPQTAW